MLLNNPLLPVIFKRRPPLTYNGVISAAASASTLDLTGLALGPAHPSKVIILAIGADDTAAQTVSSVTYKTRNFTRAAFNNSTGTGQLSEIWYLPWPHSDLNLYSGMGATVTFSGACTERSCFSFAAFPRNPAPIDNVGGGTTGASVVMSDLEVKENGFVIGVSRHRNANNTSWTWTGTDVATVVNLAFAADNSSVGYFKTNASNTTLDMTASWTTSNNGGAAIASWY